MLCLVDLGFHLLIHSLVLGSHLSRIDRGWRDLYEPGPWGPGLQHYIPTLELHIGVLAKTLIKACSVGLKLEVVGPVSYTHLRAHET